MVQETINMNVTGIFNLGRTIYAFDSTTIGLHLAVFYRAKFQKRKPRIKIHTFYNVEAQVSAFFHITTASAHDSQAMKELPIESDAFYIFEQAYDIFEQAYDVFEQLYRIIVLKSSLS